MAKILIIDDSDLSRNAVKRFVAGEHEIVEARNGMEGIKLCHSDGPDLVICDLLMPEMDGFKFLAALKSVPGAPKVIICSANVQQSAVSRALELGAVAFLKKPLINREKELAEAVRSALHPGPKKVLSDSQIDALREIMNVGVGRAAASMSELVSAPVDLSIPEVGLFDSIEANHLFRDVLVQEAIYVQQDFSGAFGGSVLLVFPALSGMNLVRLFSSGATSVNTFSESDKAALMEIGNILVNACIGSLANILSIDLDFKLPKLQLQMPKSVHAFVPGQEVTQPFYLLYIKTRFAVHEKEVEGYFNLLLESKSLGKLLDQMKEKLG